MIGDKYMCQDGCNAARKKNSNGPKGIAELTRCKADSALAFLVNNKRETERLDKEYKQDKVFDQSLKLPRWVET